MKIFNIIKKAGILTILIIFIFPVVVTYVYAVDCTKEYCPLTTIPGAIEGCTPTVIKNDKGAITGYDTSKCVSTDPVKVIKNIYGISIGLGAMLAVVMIIWAGIEYATTESITGHSDAKEKWQSAIFGMVLLLASYIILRTINVDLVNIDLGLGKVIIGDAVTENSIEKLLKDIDEALQAQNTRMQERNKTALENTQARIDELKEQLKNPNLTSTEKVALQKQLDFANTSLADRKIDQTLITQAETIKKSMAEGKPFNFGEMKSTINSEIARLKTLAEKTTDDEATRRLIDKRISDLKSKAQDLTKATEIVANQIKIYNVVKEGFGQAKPATPNMTVDQFRRQLVGQETLVDGQKATPISLIQKTVAAAPAQNLEITTVIATHGAQASKAVEAIIDKRVSCYDSFKKGSLASGCSSF